MCVSEDPIDKSVTSPARTHALNGTRDFIGKAPGSLIMGIPSGIPALLANVNDGVGVPDIRVGFFSRSRIAPPMRLISEAAAPPQCRCSGCAAHARHPAKLPYYFACLYLVAGPRRCSAPDKETPLKVRGSAGFEILFADAKKAGNRSRPRVCA